MSPTHLTPTPETDPWFSSFEDQKHTPEGNTLPSAKVHLDKDFKYDELNQKYKDWNEKIFFESLNCKITDILSSPEKKSAVNSL